MLGSSEAPRQWFRNPAGPPESRASSATLCFTAAEMVNSFEFLGTEGRRLVGRLESPSGQVRGWALFAHCFTCGKDNLAAVRIARTLAGRGIGVLRFDFAGIGESEGPFAETSFASNVEDIVAGCGAMAEHGWPASLLIGHSLGGAAVLAAAGQCKTVRAVATINAPFDVAHALAQFSTDDLAAIERDGSAEVRLAERPFRVGRKLIDSLRMNDQGKRIAALHRPLLVLHAPTDNTRIDRPCDANLFGGAPSQELPVPGQVGPSADPQGGCGTRGKPDRRLGRRLCRGGSRRAAAGRRRGRRDRQWQVSASAQDRPAPAARRRAGRFRRARIQGHLRSSCLPPHWLPA